jgi:hypothetical protein
MEGSAGAPVGGGMVRENLWGADTHNVTLLNGPEHLFNNPAPGRGLGTPEALTVKGTDYIMRGEDPLTTFTLWFGYMDVGIDVDGNGFTLSNSFQEGGLVGLSLGRYSSIAVIPEPSIGLTLAAAGSLLAARRRRRA